MNYILFDDSSHQQLLPFTFTRPVADIRIGILTIREKWERYLQKKTSSFTEKYLCEKFPINIEEINILLNGSVLPNKELLQQIQALKPAQVLLKDKILIAA